MVVIVDKIAKVTDFISGTTGIIAMMIICYDVVGRYFMPTILVDWTLEVVIYLVVWALFLCVINLPLKRSHISTDIVTSHLSNKTRYKLELLSSFAGLVFCLIFLFYGAYVVEFAYGFGEIGNTSLQFPKWIYYLFLPISMFLQCIGYTLRIVYDLKSTPDELFNQDEIKG